MTLNSHGQCHECNHSAPSQIPLPSKPANPPSTQFEQIFADLFEFGGHHYLVDGDCLSRWSEIFSTPSGSSTQGPVSQIILCSFSDPEEISSDGNPEFTACTATKFLQRWGVRHHMSSAYHPQSYGRAEVAVKNAKRLLRSNMGPTGTLNNNRLLHAPTAKYS